jgi:hypothetical protein
MTKSSARQFLRASVATALRRMRGPLPEVSEVPWSEWEDTVNAWDAADTGPATEAPAVTVTDSDWATWIATVKATRKR